MSPLQEIPLENVNIEYITLLKEFVHPILFPFDIPWKDQRILYAGENEKMFRLLQDQFSDSQVQRVAIENIISGRHQLEPGSFIYIAAAGIKFSAVNIGHIYKRLISLLKPGGIIAGGVYGYAGYYGLDMVSTIIKHFSADIENSPENKNIARIKKITEAVIDQLPENHPAYHRKTFMERLSRGDHSALKELVNISSEKIFSVSRLLDCIEQWGGKFIDWVVPAFYNPVEYMEKKEVVETLEKLKPPGIWQVSELVNASPPEHSFFLGRKDHQPIKIQWDSNDLYLWRPKRLPLYQWKNVNATDANGCSIKPIKECEGIGSKELKSWEAHLCRAASGTVNLNQLLADLKIPQSQVINFLKRALEMRLLALLPP